jgi:2-C-methyl-D-erythritol 4-phosphate cytidylyltransferase
MGINGQFFSAIIPAAGSGDRLGAKIPKALVVINGKTLIERAVQSILPHVEEIIIAAPKDFELEISGLFSDNKKIKVISGGEVRSKSVAAALSEVDKNADYILVHDAARCFATQAQTMRVINALLDGDLAVVPGVEVVDTIKVIDSNNFAESTPSRSTLRAVQTPQGFSARILHRAHESGNDATDDAALVEALGIPVRVVAGEVNAHKITTPADLEWAKRLVETNE